MCLFYFMDNKVFFFQRPSKSGTGWYVRAFRRTQFNNVGPLKTFKKLFLFIPFLLHTKPRQTNVVRSQVGNVFAFYIRFACTFILITCLSPNVAFSSVGVLTTTTPKRGKRSVRRYLCLKCDAMFTRKFFQIYHVLSFIFFPYISQRLKSSPYSFLSLFYTSFFSHRKSRLFVRHSWHYYEMKNVPKLSSISKKQEASHLECVFAELLYIYVSRSNGLNGRIDCFSVFLSVLFTIYLTLIGFIWKNIHSWKKKSCCLLLCCTFLWKIR